MWTNHASDFWLYVEKERGRGCWRWRGPTHRGYPMFKSEGRVYLAHRWAWLRAKRGRARYANRDIIPSCGDRLCVRPDHMTLGRFHPIGATGRPKLTWKKVREIRRRYASGRTTQEQLAKRFAITQGAISALLCGRTWREVT